MATYSEKLKDPRWQKKRLEILERTKELIENNPDITREEIREIIQSEFDIELPANMGNGMGFRHRGRCGSCGPRGFMSEEDSE